MSKAERNLEALNALRQQAGMLGEMLGGEAEELGQAFLNAFSPKSIRKKWNEHLSGKRNWQYQLWSVLMFQSWLEHNR